MVIYGFKVKSVHFPQLNTIHKCLQDINIEVLILVMKSMKIPFHDIQQKILHQKLRGPST